MPATRKSPGETAVNPAEARKQKLAKDRRDWSRIKERLDQVRELLRQDPTTLSANQRAAMATLPGLELKPLCEQMPAADLVEYFARLERDEKDLLRRLCSVEAQIRAEENENG